MKWTGMAGLDTMLNSWIESFDKGKEPKSTLDFYADTIKSMVFGFVAGYGGIDDFFTPEQGGKIVEKALSSGTALDKIDALAESLYFVLSSELVAEGEELSRQQAAKGLRKIISD